MTDEDYRAIIDEALIDSYGDVEQIASFCAYLQDEIRFPLDGMIAGSKVRVTGLTNDNSRALGVVVSNNNQQYEIDLMSITFTEPPNSILAYTKWRTGW